MPPLMGAGAYMMLEIVDPPVTCLRIIRAALIPAILYYLSLFLIAHFHARGIAIADTGGDGPAEAAAANPLAESRHEGIVFATALGFLILLLILGYTPFRAVTASLVGIVVVGAFNERTRLSVQDVVKVFVKSARDVVSLVAGRSVSEALRRPPTSPG